MYLVLCLFSCIFLTMATNGEENLNLGRFPSAYNEDEFFYGTFPPGFIWSTSTSAYQVEGGWNADGKEKSIWDTFTHQSPSPIQNGDTGDIASKSYQQFKEDVQLLQELGVTSYRFSISWSRILPNGDISFINQPGVDYYNALIDELMKFNIEPTVTLYHWDLPQVLQDKGGWENPLIVKWFTEYAKTAYSLFGNRVKRWITINSPLQISLLGHGIGNMAPGLKDLGFGVYQVSHNLIKAHASAWHIYNDEFRRQQQGEVGISLYSDFKYPKSSAEEDQIAAERSMQFMLGWFAHPIFHPDGDYPLMMKQIIEAKSKLQGLYQSRLPCFTPSEIKYIKGSSDFFGLNHYTTQLVKNKILDGEPNYFADIDTVESQDPEWIGGASPRLKIVPWGLRELLRWIKKEYGDTWEIFITENGWSDNESTLDEKRVLYFRQYINSALKAINLDGVNLKSYSAWSLMDGFEWGMGYTEKYGLYFVNKNDSSKKRTPKLSALAYKVIVKSNGFISSSNASYYQKNEL